MARVELILFVLLNIPAVVLPQEVLTIGQAFDFNVRDEFHIRDNEGVRPPNAQRITVLEKHFSTNKDTVFYKLYYDTYSTVYNFQTGDLEYHFSTDTQEVYYTKLDSSVYDYYSNLKYSSLLEIQNENPGSSFNYDSIHYLSQELCDSLVDGFQVSLGEFEPNFYHIEFGKGLGLTYHEFIDGSSGSDIPSYSKRLFYYKKGDYSCGIPDLTNNVQDKTKSPGSFTVVQSTVNQEIIVYPQDASLKYEVELYGIDGRRVLIREERSGICKIPYGRYNPGAYILSIRSSKYRSSRKLIL